MPEGDSYVHAAARIGAVLAGRTLERVDGNPSVRRWAPRLRGRRVVDVRTHGKHLVIDVDGGLAIHVWLGMAGEWRVWQGRRSAAGAERGPARLLLSTSAHTVAVFAAPTVEVERRKVIDRLLASLGPDLLADTFDWDLFRRRLAGVSPATTVADLLLDQRVVAGIGNEYKSEVLFLERRHPLTRVGTLSQGEIGSMVDRARRLMVANTPRPGPRTFTGNRGPGRGAYVFERTGKPCRRCRSGIVQAWIGDRFPRVTYWCPDCQPAPADDARTTGGRRGAG